MKFSRQYIFSLRAHWDFFLNGPVDTPTNLGEKILNQVSKICLFVVVPQAFYAIVDDGDGRKDWVKRGIRLKYTHHR